MHVVINIDEKIGKTVGRRKPPAPLDTKTFTPENAREWRRAFKTRFIPRGVYRFATHEEADAWLMKMLTRRNSNRETQPSPTSENSAAS